MGGSQLSNGTNAWASSRYYTSFAWSFYGFSGFLNYGGYFYYSYLAAPLALFELGTSE